MIFCNKCNINLFEHKELFGDLMNDGTFLCTKCINNWYCYIVRSSTLKYINHSYVGMTNNPPKRIRQHNGIIKGGAIKTLRMKNNEMYCVIKGFESKIEAMQAEWRIKHPDKKRKVQRIYNGIDGRIRGLNIIFADSKLTMNSKRLLKDMQLTIWLIKDKEHLLTYIPPNIKLIIVDKIDLQNI